jgi:ubiquinone/menaquinone biosynthesis C-methylase UbiE
MSEDKEVQYKWYVDARNPLRRMQRRVLLGNCSGKRILDIGGGTGRTGNALIQHGYEVTVLDKNENIMRFGQEIHSPLVFVKGDAYRLPFKTEIFDEVILEEIIEHFEDQGKAIEEVYRVLRQGGRVILSTPNKYQFRFYIFVLRLVTLRVNELMKHVKSHTNELNPDQLEGLFIKFRERTVFGINPFCQFLAKKFPKLGVGLLGIFKK